VPPAAGSSASGLDWPQYLHGSQHSSVGAATAFTPSNAASATLVWHWPATGAAPALDASPTVVAGKVYIGSQNGYLYALNESTGAPVWKHLLGVEKATTCSHPRGVSATAAVLPDPVTGVSTVYDSGPRYVFALNAATGAVVWKTEIGPATAPTDAYYNWSSPTVAGGHIYVGISSDCDNPLIRGGVEELDQHTGAVLHSWFSVPNGSIGGSVWSSIAASASGSDVWVSTGNECNPTVDTCPSGNQTGNSLSIVHLSGSLGFLQAWQVPPSHRCTDCDFGSSPTLFGSSATPPDVGACNKNGDYYALAASPLGTSPLWAAPIGQPANGDLISCLASAVWDGPAGTMYIGGNTTTIGGTTYGGSVRQVNPATGGFIWQRGLPCAVMGSPSLDSAGVLAAGTYNCAKLGPASSGPPGAYLINAATGAILKTLPVGSGKVFGQPVFAQNTLFVATESNGLYNFAP
jgi:outer membrane protein assembly factor BamB